MKKPLQKIDAKKLDVTQRASVKRTSRLSKRNVFAIAPVDADIEHCDSLRELCEETTPNGLHYSISSDLATNFSCKLMAIALQLRLCSLASDEQASIQNLTEELLDGFEEAGNLTASDGNCLTRLQSLLQRLHRGELFVRETGDSVPDEETKQVLTSAIHSVILSQSQRVQFEQAVESASQRAIYQFAYGLTHEINNPLANIAARAQQMIVAAQSETDRRSLATIVDQSMRAHEMLAEMMRVVQPRSIHPRVEDIVEIVKHVAVIQESQWTQARIQCNLRVSEKPLFCSVERAAIVEALCCVLQNAIQVCRPNDRIEILCQQVNFCDSDYGQIGMLDKVGDEASPRIRIAIRDTGPGLSYETEQRAWDLYFSGREHGRGLGISLALARRTIDAHGGLIWIQSNPNAGCTVEMRLPKSAEPPNPRKAFSI